MRSHRSIDIPAAATALAGALGLAGAAVAQPAGDEEPSTAAKSEIMFSVQSGYEHGFEAGIEGGGDLAVSRARFGLRAETELEPDLDLSLRFSYALDQYDFSGTTRLGGAEPWDDVHTVGFGALLQWTATNDWVIFGGPVVQFSRETDAAWDEAWIAGGVLGATHVVNDRLIVGGGLGVVSQIEDDLKVFPVLVLNWQFHEKLRLSTLGGTGTEGQTSLELIYDWGGEWEIALGGRYEFRRFRLDDDGIAPGGAGEETSLPIWARLSKRLNDNFSVDLYGGLATGGSLELEDSGGNPVGDEDFDPATFVGLSVRIRF